MIGNWNFFWTLESMLIFGEIPRQVTSNNFRNPMMGMNVIIFLSFALGSAHNTTHKEVGFHHLCTDPHGFNKVLF